MPARDAPARLVSVGGPEVPSIPLEGTGPWIVGRARECEICLPGATVSRRHAQLAWRNKAWSVEDLGSRHGSNLNGVHLEPNRVMRIEGGDLLKFGPFVMRLEVAGVSSVSTMSIDVGLAPGSVVRRASDEDLERIAVRRLRLLIEGAEATSRAENETTLAEAVVRIATAATGYPRAFFLRLAGEAMPEIVAQRLGSGDRDPSFSHSLVREAGAGAVVHLEPAAAPGYGVSINQLGIAGAVCAPLLVDGAAVGALYLDTRDGEPPAEPDALGFCHALARLAGLSIGALRRKELEERQRKVDEEIRLARQAHAFLSPPASGAFGHVQFALRSLPGRHIPGDLFDVFPIGDERVGFCLGDAVGQGLRAGILMTAILSHVRAGLETSGDPSIAARAVNRFIEARSDDGTFASLIVGVLDRAAGTLCYVDAGHGHWFLRRAGRPPEHAGQPDGTIVGILAEETYESRTIPFHPGDRIILYSDGMIEQRAGGEAFGEERLAEALTTATDPESDVARSFAALESFLGGPALGDDTTLASIMIAAD